MTAALLMLALSGCGGDPSNHASRVGDDGSAVDRTSAASSDDTAPSAPTALAPPTAAGTLPSAAGLVIRRAPQDVIAAEGDMAQFSVEAGGPRGISYQWLRDDEPIVGATGVMLQLPVAADDHLTHISVLVSAQGTSLRSRQAVLRVLRH